MSKEGRGMSKNDVTWYDLYLDEQAKVQQQAQEIERFRKGELWGKFDYYRAKAQHLEEALKENKKFLEWILEEYATSDKSVSDFVDEAEIYFDVTNEALKEVRGNEGRD
jgi:hypothetical protein